MPVAVFDEDYKKAADALTWVPPAVGVAGAIAAERERCAQIAEHLNGWGGKPNHELARHIAKVIRAG